MCRQFRRPNIERLQRSATFKKVLDRCKACRRCPHCNSINGVVKCAALLLCKLSRAGLLQALPGMHKAGRQGMCSGKQQEHRDLCTKCMSMREQLSPLRAIAQEGE